MKIRLIVALALALTIGCAKAPPNLTPEASIAFKGTQVVKALDVLRDTAIAANDQHPPLLDEATTRTVVTYHQSMVKVIQSSPNGWKATVQLSLDEMVKSLPPNAKRLLTPYVDLTKLLLSEVTK